MWFTYLPIFMTLFQLLLCEALFLLKATRRKMFALRAPCFCVGAALLMLLYAYFSFTYALHPIITYLLVWVVAAGVAYGCFRINVFGVLFVSTAGYAIQHASHDIFTLITIDSDVLPMIWLDYLITFAAIAAVYFAIIRRLPHCYDNADHRNIFVSVIVLCVSIVIDRSTNDRSASIVITVYDLIICVFCFLLQFTISFGKQRKNENNTLKDMLEKEHKTHELSNQSIQMMNIKLHDLNHRLADLQQLLNDNDDDEKKAIADIRRTVKLYGQMANSGNSTVDAILMEKGLISEINKIQFSYIVDGKQLDFMDAVDTFSLFNNILDNAIEHEIKEPEDRRLISLRTMRTGDSVLVSIENYISAPIPLIDGLPSSDKGDKALHGYGMKGVKYVVDKYNGSMQIAQENDMFILSIVFTAAEAK